MFFQYNNYSLNYWLILYFLKKKKLFVLSLPPNGRLCIHIVLFKHFEQLYCNILSWNAIRSNIYIHILDTSLISWHLCTNRTKDFLAFELHKTR